MSFRIIKPTVTTKMSPDNNIITKLDDARPLSLYDNLQNSNQSHPLTSTPAMKSPVTPQQTHNNLISDTRNSVGEFPFSDITFKFDDLPITKSPLTTPINTEETSNLCYNKKPVISDAKSTFFGLNNNNNCNNNNNNNNNNTMDNKNILIKNDNKEQDVEPEVQEELILELQQHNDDDLNENDDNNTPTLPLIKGSNGTNSGKHITLIADDLSETNLNSTQPTSTSQAVYMATTVPQNIKGSNIMGRHTPTRNSLRHSRMLVINKNYSGRHPTAINIALPGLAKALLILQLICGIIVTCLGVWLLLWAPNTRTRDNPYWSGLSLILSGTFGIILMEFKRIPRNKLREHLFIFIKINTIIIIICTLIFTIIAFIFATIHINNLKNVKRDCYPTNLFTSSSACVCIFNRKDGELKNENLLIKNINNEELIDNTDGSYEFHYRDLSCNEVSGPWRYILGISIIFNLIGFLTALGFFILFSSRTKRKQPYLNVRP